MSNRHASWQLEHLDTIMHFVCLIFRSLHDCRASGMFAANNVMICPALVRKLVFLQESESIPELYCLGNLWL